MSNEKNEIHGAIITDAGSHGIHVEPQVGKTTVISNVSVSRSAGSGIFFSSAPSTPPPLPPPVPPTRKFGWKSITAALVVVGAIIGVLADGTQILESQLLKDATGWFTAPATPPAS
jgi:hypothetical protein